MDIQAFLTPEPPISVTPWSKKPSKAYEPVSFEMYAICDMQQVMILLTRDSGFTMALHLTAAGVDLLLKELHVVQREFKAQAQATLKKPRAY